MEAEKDLIEAIAHARTKEEKAELQKQLDELKAMRRQLDKSLR
jgi:sensor histidine kinase regulating citrate/malate metabolism